MRNLKLLTIVLTGCTASVAIDEDSGSTSGASITITDRLSGCEGLASSTIPANGQYVMTTFGGGGDTQNMSCGGKADGVGWYAASRQRYGCGAKLQVEANGNCVVVSALDYGPDVCVEAAAHSPILDMSPAASKALYDVPGAGWSDHLIVTVTQVDAATPTGVCGSDTGGGSGSGSGGDTGGDPGASCSSSTLDRDVDDGTCVQSASDESWYQCTNGTWDSIDSSASCDVAYAWCDSATLGESVPPLTCVQSASSGTWFQCNGQTWVTPVDTSSESGPLGDCASWNPL